ncbi:hypothetical protein BC828DRAFT_400325 [Blastocladiella britannica]|nr:hypothetical protein BC828DRAFT_400325 [Blastocladiella britannica]
MSTIGTLPLELLAQVLATARPASRLAYATREFAAIVHIAVIVPDAWTWHLTSTHDSHPDASYYTRRSHERAELRLQTRRITPMNRPWSSPEENGLSPRPMALYLASLCEARLRLPRDPRRVSVLRVDHHPLTRTFLRAVFFGAECLATADNVLSQLDDLTSMKDSPWDYTGAAHYRPRLIPDGMMAIVFLMVVGDAEMLAWALDELLAILPFNLFSAVTARIGPMWKLTLNCQSPRRSLFYAGQYSAHQSQRTTIGEFLALVALSEWNVAVLDAVLARRSHLGFDLNHIFATYGSFSANLLPLAIPQFSTDRILAVLTRLHGLGVAFSHQEMLESARWNNNWTSEHLPIVDFLCSIHDPPVSLTQLVLLWTHYANPDILRCKLLALIRDDPTQVQLLSKLKLEVVAPLYVAEVLSGEPLPPAVDAELGRHFGALTDRDRANVILEHGLMQIMAKCRDPDTLGSVATAFLTRWVPTTNSLAEYAVQWLTKEDLQFMRPAYSASTNAKLMAVIFAHQRQGRPLPLVTATSPWDLDSEYWYAPLAAVCRELLALVESDSTGAALESALMILPPVLRRSALDLVVRGVTLPLPVSNKRLPGGRRRMMALVGDPRQSLAVQSAWACAVLVCLRSAFAGVDEASENNAMNYSHRHSMQCLMTHIWKASHAESTIAGALIGHLPRRIVVANTLWTQAPFWMWEMYCVDVLADNRPSVRGLAKVAARITRHDGVQVADEFISMLPPEVISDPDFVDVVESAKRSVEL